MPTTVTTVSRLEVDHPDLGHDAGALLHSRVRNAWTKFGDHMDSRFFIQDALADSASVDFDHNFKTEFEDLKFDLYERDTGTGELTRIKVGGTPDLDDFTVVATPGDATTQIRITNNTGGPVDLAIVVSQRGASEVRFVDQFFAAAGGGPYSVTQSFGASTPIDVYFNGQLRKETDAWDRDVANNEIDVNVNFPSGELMVRVWNV